MFNTINEKVNYVLDNKIVFTLLAFLNTNHTVAKNVALSALYFSISISTTVLLTSTSAQAEVIQVMADSDGDGINDDIDVDDDNDNLIEISTLAELNEMRYDLTGATLFDNNQGCASTCIGFELVNNLDFDSNGDGVIDVNDSYWNDGLGWQPIGLDYDNQFVAKLNGNGFVIKNLFINRPAQENIGLFGNIGSNAEVKSLGLENVFIKGKYGVGAIAGRSDSANYQNIYSTGYIEGLSSTGGLFGSIDGSTIINAYHVGRVYAPDGNVGGVVGDASYGKYVNIYNIGPVTGSWDVGGLFGTLEDAETDGLINGYSVGLVSGGGSVGGIVGDIYTSKLTNVYSIAKVSGSEKVGAIAGDVDTEGFSESEINNSYWLQSSAEQAFGRAYNVDATISLSDVQLKCPQSAGDVNCSAIAFTGWDDITPHWNFGNATQYPSLFLAGENYQIGDFDSDGVADNDDYFPTISIANYPDIDSDGIPDTCNAACLASGLLPDNDADFDGISDDQDIDDDNDDLIEIRTLADLNEIRNSMGGQALYFQDSGCYSVCVGYELVNDLDFDTNGDGVVNASDEFWNDGLGWNPIGDPSGMEGNYFVSVFEGRGYSIKNLTINRPEQNYIGLFGATEDGAEIYNLQLMNVNISGSSETGSLAGDTNYTTIENVSITGSVSGVDAVGGLVGYSEYSSINEISFIGRVLGTGDEVAGIVGCSEYDFIYTVAHIGPVTGNNSVGGILGCNYSTVRDAFSTGVITGDDQVGGIAGYQNDAVIKRTITTSSIVANTRFGAVTGWANGEGNTLEDNYYLTGTAPSGLGENEITDTTIGLTLAELTCAQSPGDDSCSTVIYSNFDRYEWNFGDSTQLPALPFNDKRLRIADYDQDGSNDSEDLYPSISVGTLTDTDHDGVPDNCELSCLNKGLLADNDDDNDGVPDNDDAFPLDITEYLDSDLDGIGDNADVFPLDPTESADGDLDGIGDNADVFPLDPTESADGDLDSTGDNADVFPLDPTESADSDLDGIGDNADVFPLDPTETIDTDLDGIGNNADTDDDNDGIIDEFDGASLNAEIGDIQPPVFTYSDAIFINAQGRLTDISSFIDISATDDVDGEISSQIVGETLLASGQHYIELIATDSAGNSASYQAEINIKPEVSLVSQITAEAGGNYRLAVSLSGAAPHYPVEILYYTYLNGEVIDETWVNIATGTQGEIVVAVPDNLAVSDNMSISLEFASPAHLGENIWAELTLVDKNIAPKMQTLVSQNGDQVTSIDPDNGMVTVQVNIDDINHFDEHAVTWLVADNAFNDAVLDSDNTSFEINPSILSAGRYAIEVTATENNTSEAYKVSKTLYLTVEKLADLPTDVDSDNDGINDSEEGYSDSDGDGIVDYLDDNSNTTELPSSDNTAPMQTAPGLTMALGTIVRTASGSASENASLTLKALADAVGEEAADTKSSDFSATTPLYNFTIDGLREQGDSVAVIIPLESGTSLPEEAVYRKYNTVDGWYTFVENDKNSVSSAAADINGNCPVANDDNYALGLTAGDNCIQLIIEDGGANDADFEVNGSVEDPGAVMIASANTEPSIPEPTEPVTVEPKNTSPEVTIIAHEESYDEASQIKLIAQGIDAEGDNVTYSWTQLSGAAVSFADVDSAEVIIHLPEVDNDEVIELQVSVSDGEFSSLVTTEITIINLAQISPETPASPEAEDTTDNSSSGGSISYLLLPLLLMARYQRLKRVS